MHGITEINVIVVYDVVVELVIAVAGSTNDLYINTFCVLSQIEDGALLGWNKQLIV